MLKIQNNNEFQIFVKEIKERILSSQYEALKKVNKELRKFLLEYYENEKLQLLVGEISWTKDERFSIGYSI